MVRLISGYIRMKNPNSTFLIIWILVVVGMGCIKPKKIDNTKNSDFIEKSDPAKNNLEVEDFGAGKLSYAVSYEKLLVPANYNHFYQFNSSSNVASCCLATSYMIGKGFFGFNVDDPSLQKIITGMKTDDLGISGYAALFFGQLDWGTNCIDYLTLSTKDEAFAKLYETINNGYPTITLINIKEVNGVYKLVSDKINTRHWVLVVGIRVNKQNLKRGEIIFIDPLSKTPKLKYAQSEDFLNSSLSASSLDPQQVNMIKLGCPGQAIDTNYFGSIEPVSDQIPSDKSINVNIPVSISWTSKGADACYRIQVASSTEGWSATNGFSDVFISNPVFFDFLTNTNDTSLGYQTDPNKSYFWTVKSFVNGVSSNYSVPIWFQTKPKVVPAPTALPAININNSSFECRWTGDYLMFNNYYELLIATDSGFTQLLPWPGPFPPQPSTPYYTVYNLNSNTWYYYKVRQVLDGGTSLWSNVISVKTN